MFEGEVGMFEGDFEKLPPASIPNRVGRHWWFNYPCPLLDAEFEFACLQVRLNRLPPCIALIRPSQLSSLNSSVGRTLCSGFESHLSSSFFIFLGKRDVQVSCIAFL